MERKIMTGFALLLLVGILTSSGCVQKVMDAVGELSGGECAKIEKELEKQGADCNCYPTDMVPDKLKNISDIKGKCYCTCQVNGKQYNVSIVQAPGEGTRVVK